MRKVGLARKKGGEPGWRNYPNAQTVKSKPKAAPPVESWWADPRLHADRSAFMRTAYRKHPSVTPPITLNLARSVGGHNDL